MHQFTAFPTVEHKCNSVRPHRSKLPGYLPTVSASERTRRRNQFYVPPTGNGVANRDGAWFESFVSRDFASAQRRGARTVEHCSTD
jgi:hypothetical protein